MVKCNTCIHQHACEAWIKHGTTLYDDFTYSLENCTHYMATIAVVDQMIETLKNKE